MKHNNVLEIRFGENTKIETAVRFQWDKGQIIKLLDMPDGTEVQFANGFDKIGNKRVEDGQVEIPDILLQRNSTITAYFRDVNSTSETTKKVATIPVKNKPKPPDYIEPENEQTFRQYVEEVMTAIKSIAEDVQSRADSGEFDGKDYVLTEEDKEEIAGMVEGGGTGGNGTTDYNNLENIPTVNGTEVKGNLTLEELGLYSRTEIDTKFGTKITLYTGTTAPSSSPSAYPDFVEPSLYFDKSTKKLYRLFSTEHSIVYHEFAFSYNHYTKTEINSMLDALSSLNFEIVGSLPTENISTTTIYLVPKSTDNDINFYNEYIYIADRWEIIGTTEVDLSNYPTFEEMETAIGDSIQNIKVDIPTPTETTKGGIFAKSVEDTDGMAEVVIGSDGKAYVDALSVDVGGAF